MAGNFPAGLTLWARYKASDMIAVGDGNAVGQWDDSSGNARHATQGTVARKPLLRTTTTGLLGNTISIEFLGNDTNPHALTVPDMSALTSGFIATFVIGDTDTNEVGPTTNVRRIWAMGTGGTGGKGDGYYKYTNTGGPAGIYESFGTNARKTCGDTTPTSGVLTRWHSYMVASASGACTNWLNNVQFFNTGTNTVAFLAAPELGGYVGGSSGIRLANKKYTEIVICSAVPSAADRAALQQYFIDEYAGGSHRRQTFTRQAQTRASFY